MNARMPATEDLIYVVDDGIARLTFNRPQARNALTFAMYEQMASICESVNADRSIKATFPSVSDCMVCHENIKTDSPEIKKLAGNGAPAATAANASGPTVSGHGPKTMTGNKAISQGAATAGNPAVATPGVRKRMVASNGSKVDVLKAHANKTAGNGRRVVVKSSPNSDA